MPRSDFSFSFRVRARFAEIDSQAVVFNSRYLEYADIAITEYWRALGVSQVPGPDTPEFHVVKATVEFKVPIRIDEEIDLCVRTARIGATSLTSAMEFHGKDREDLRANVELVHVHVDLHSGKAQPLPPALRALLDGHLLDEKGAP